MPHIHLHLGGHTRDGGPGSGPRKGGGSSQVHSAEQHPVSVTHKGKQYGRTGKIGVRHRIPSGKIYEE